MILKLHNTYSRKLEVFQPIEKNKIRFYQCGPTVYWVQHIGNMRAMVMADLIRRSFEYLGYQVKFVRNYTDVGHLTSDSDEGEDKMEKAAKRDKLTPQQVAEKYISIFEKDIFALNTLAPTFKPRASQYVEKMIEMIKVLLEKKQAYITDLAIYFDVSTFKNYTALSHQKLNLQRPNTGRGKVIDPQKRHFYDFSLWFFKKGEHKNALQTWISPWGEGFPGWHIECSVMSLHLLGETIDLHMGGVEHIPIHHTNEIAQSESYTGKKFVNYWLHNEHLLVDNKKMAKSEGTGITLNDVIKRGFDPLDLRYFFLQAHYRSKQNFTWESLQAARNARLKLIDFLKEYKNDNKTPTSPSKKILHSVYKKEFISYLSLDFQIPQALSLVWQVVDDKKLTNEEKISLFLDFDQVFGLKLAEQKPEEIPDFIIKLAIEREKARKRGDFEKADQFRQKIQKSGYQIEDKKDGFRIRKSKENSL